jgi:cytidylate kinase
MTANGMIAIDGPAASGKSTLAQNLAARLGYLYFDTGVMYRAVTLAALEKGISPNDENGVNRLARSVCIDVQPPSVPDGRQYDVLLDGQDVTWQIRRPEVDANVSQVSTYRGVREAMTQRQREIGLRGRVVMAGRDIGTVVLPEAELKIYLDATVEERARRRVAEARQRGEQADAAAILQSMRRRDRIDSSREIAPLRAAEDAVLLDSTDMSIDGVLEKAMALVEEAGMIVAANELVRQSGGGKGSAESDRWRPIIRHSLGVRLFRRIARPIFRGLFWVLSRVQVEGADRVPSSGGYLVAGNHVSIVDPALIIAFWPEFLEAAGADTVLERPIQGRLMRYYGAMQVHRGMPDRALLEMTITCLQAGLPVLMDPEGRRSHQPGMQQAKNGVAYVAGKAHVPVVPVGVIGTEKVNQILSPFRRPALRMVIGEPLYLPPIPWGTPRRKAALKNNTEILMRAIAVLLPPEYRGVYGHER